MTDFLMPALGADMDEGTLLEWLVKPGDQVHKGEVIAVVDTAKAAIEVESFATGTMERLIVEPGETVPVGTVLATITEPAAEGVQAAPSVTKPSADAKTAPGTMRKPAAQPGRKAPAKPGRRTAAKPKAVAKPRPAAEQRPAAQREPAAAVPTANRAIAFPAHPETWSPLVRHLADELGINLETVLGTGPGGAINRADVAAAAAAAAARHNGRPEAQRDLEQPRERAPRVRVPQEPRPVVPRPPGAPGRLRITPFARRVAADLGIELASVTGTGPGGAIQEADVRRAAGEATTEGGAVAVGVTPRPTGAAETAPVTGPTRAQERLQAMRNVTARLMARSKREIPHYYLRETIDMTRAMAWLHDRNRELDVTERLVPPALLLKASAMAARQVPALNGFWTGDHFVPGRGVHLGVAISLRGGGLITPAIHDAADLPPLALMNRLRDLVTRARSGRLRNSELTDATITVTNLGDQGVELVYGVIYPPQVALVGFGKVTDRAVAVNGMVGARPVVITTLSADHRATDGYTGARFLTALSDLLQHPEDT
jgi:pyruvate dehydrogenase E2 component (dihydrolipoamide acetyltransferase)